MEPRPAYEGLAPYYDLVYRGIDHAADVRFLREAFDRYARNPVRRVLDLGCGSGSHAILLAREGVEVVGLDLSEGLVRRAREKAAREPAEVAARLRFDVGDMAGALPDGPFDAVVSLFGSLNYLTEDHRLAAMLRAVAERLRPDGVFAAEFWNPIGIRPQARWARDEVGDGSELYHLIAGRYETLTDLYHLRMEGLRLQGDRVVDRFAEDHALRARTPAAMARLVTGSGLRLEAFAKGDVNAKSLEEPPHDAMRVMVIARRA